METKAVIISGEAPESDDESISIKTGIAFPSLLASNSCGTIIQGEARESDDENSSISSTGYVVNPSTCTYINVKSHKGERSSVKYNSLLHKKLKECNKSFDRDVKELLGNTVLTAVEQLNDTNRQLLKSELVLQDTVSKLQVSAGQFEDTLAAMFRVLDEDYFKAVKL